MAITAGQKVSIHYNLKVDGKQVDTSEGRDPLSFVYGDGEVIPGVEEEISGMSSGEKKSFRVEPDKGYGARRDEAVQRVPKDAFKEMEGISAGSIVVLEASNGQAFQATVAELTDDEVVLDLNHPLAGKTLDFEIEIVSVEDAPSKIIKPGE